MNKFDTEIKQLQQKICNHARGEQSLKKNQKNIEDCALALLNAIRSLRGITTIESAIVNLCDRPIHLNVADPLDKKLYMAGRSKISSDDQIVSARADNRTALTSVMKKVISASKRAEANNIDAQKYESVKTLNDDIKNSVIVDSWVSELIETSKELMASVKIIKDTGKEKQCIKAKTELRKAMIALRTTTTVGKKATEVKTKKPATKKVA